MASARFVGRGLVYWTLCCFLSLPAVGWGAATDVTTQPPKPSEDLKPSGPSVHIEQTAATTVVYLEHAGPYWTVRGKLREVIAYMREHGVSGEAYVRYGASPTGGQAARTASEIGFVSRADHQAVEPFQSAGREAEWVAAMAIDTTGSIAPHHYRTLRDWVAINGHRPLGPVIELYPQGFGDRADGRSGYRVVLQMPIQRPASEQAEGSRGRPVEAVTASPRSRGEDATSPTDEATLAPEAASTAPTQEAAQPGPETAELPSFVDDGSQTMIELLKGGRVEAIAQRLMPDETPIPNNADLWLGQVVFRVSAAAKGIERTYPGEGGNVAALATAIKERYRQASTQRSGRALEQVVVRVDPRAGRTSQQRRAIVQDLDRLLGRIAVRAVDADGALVALAGELQNVAAMLKSARSAANVDG